LNRAAVALALLLAGPAAAREAPRKPPLVLQETGSFFVGGRRIHTEHANLPGAFLGVSGELMVDQTYVQYWIPQQRNARFPPIVMLHGSTHSGATYETTPDGREGWALFFVRKGVPVYVIDQAGRGRSGFDRTGIVEAKTTGDVSKIPPIVNFEHGSAWQGFRFGPTLGEAFPQTRFPMKAVDQYLAQLLPSVGGPSAVEGLTALLDRIGPAILLGHSAGGQPVVDAAVQRPDLVKAVVDVEAPAGCPVTEEGIRTAYRKVPLLAVYGDINTSYKPPKFWEDRWVKAKTDCDASVAQIVAAGGRALNMSLPDRGLLGNSHMLMMDTNSDQIAQLIYEWLEKNLR
jgi:pimeloyl-ACP methyl ester carboxylesterase